MPRRKKAMIFVIGDKVKHISNPKSEGVVVFQSNHESDKEWSVHWYNMSPGRGIYSSSELKKYY